MEWSVERSGDLQGYLSIRVVSYAMARSGQSRTCADDLFSRGGHDQRHLFRRILIVGNSWGSVLKLSAAIRL
jgi:hypothetical protein